MEQNAEPLELKASEHGPSIELQGKEIAADAPRLPLPKPEDLLRQTNEIGAALRALIVSAKKLPTKGWEPHQDPTRSLAIAQSYLQTGFMWLRKAINPQKEF